MNVQILQAASREGGPVCKEQARAPRLQPPPSQAGRPSRPPAPPPPAPSETNAAHGGLYGARRQRVARLTLRGKFGGGRQGALMRGPPAAAAARGGGGCGAQRKREPGSRAATPAHSPTPPPPATDRRQVEGAGSTVQLSQAHYGPWSLPSRRLASLRLHFLPCKMGPTLLRWVWGLINELICALGASAWEALAKARRRGVRFTRFHQPQVEAEIFSRGGTFRLGLFPTTCGESRAKLEIRASRREGRGLRSRLWAQDLEWGRAESPAPRLPW